MTSVVVALHSSDGIEWVRATVPSAELGQVWPRSVIPTPVGMIAFTEEYHPPRLAMMWHSEDGLV
jgi:hypothetical protein